MDDHRGSKLVNTLNKDMRKNQAVFSYFKSGFQKQQIPLFTSNFLNTERFDLLRMSRGLQRVDSCLRCPRWIPGLCENGKFYNYI